MQPRPSFVIGHARAQWVLIADELEKPLADESEAK
jgi:hypothetical protein